MIDRVELIIKSRAVRRQLKKLEREFPRITRNAVAREGREILKISNTLAPRDTGALIKSGFVQRRGFDITIGYTDPKALWQHEGIGPAVGSHPFKPPRQNIMDWTERKFGDRKLGKLMAIRIGQKGFKGKKFLTRAVQRRGREAGAGGIGPRILRDILSRIN